MIFCILRVFVVDISSKHFYVGFLVFNRISVGLLDLYRHISDIMLDIVYMHTYIYVCFIE